MPSGKAYWRQNTIDVPADLATVTSIDPGECDPAAAGMSRRGVDRIWEAVLDLYATGYEPGISLCIRRRGQIVLNRSIGHARGNGPGERGPRHPLLLDTPVCLFSASKAVTATLVHWLAENGLLTLDDPIAEFIPEFATRGKHRVTVHDVLAHKAGIPSFPPHVTLDMFEDPDALVYALCRCKPTSRWRRRTAYHAITGGFILGEVVKQVTGRPIEDLLQRVLREPLGMRNFTYGVSPDRNGAVAKNYFVGPPLPGPIARAAERGFGIEFTQGCALSNEPVFLNNVVPAGNMVATAEEACRFFQMLLDGGEYQGRRILRAETVHGLVRPADRMRYDRTIRIPMRYSAGLMLGHPVASLFGPKAAMAFGHQGFMNILAWADPERAMSAALLTTGKAVLGSHLRPIGRLMGRINRHCQVLPGHAVPAWTEGLPRGWAAAV